MKTKKYALIVLSILMILLVFASSASAADANATDVLSVDESTSMNNEKLALDYSLDNAVANDTNAVENEEILQNPNSDTWYVNDSASPEGDGSEARPFKTLKDALTNIELQDGNTIKIASGEYKGENNTGLEITKNLNFVKYGDSEAIFDAENLRQIWKFTEKSANITGLTFRNGKTDDQSSGAIYFDNSGGNVVNCTFTGNTASDYAGGAIYMKSGNVNNCTFTDNNAQSGGAILIGSGNVTNCTFKNNTANNGGAIGSISSVIEYCTFTDNTAKTGEGGAIYLYYGGDINNCTFTNNTAYTGGAICFINYDGDINNCTFTDNDANNGGAIYFSNGGNVTNCTFTNNNATNNGGAIYFNNGGNVNNCNFTGNTASGYAGGAIYMSSGNVTNCTFTDNNATNNGGAIYIGSGNVTNCTFTDNNATNNGGAIYSYYGSDINNCTFTDNNATNNGGAIYSYYGSDINNCTFTNNTAYTGGAIYINNGGNVNNCNFTGNNAKSKYEGGGAIYINNDGNVNNCNFTGNNGPRYGGAIYFTTYGDVTNCTFTDNKATYMGGAIHFNQQGSVSYCTFTDNNGTSWGGAIAFNGNGNVTNCAFVNNSAKYRNAISCNDPLKSAENNWWGSNNPDWKNLIYEKIPSVYAVLNITANPSEISNDKTSEIATKFVWNGTDTNATSLLPKRNIKLSSNGNLTETKGYVGLTSQFSAADGGIYYVNATVDNEMLGVNIVKIPIPTNINVTITSLNLTVEETTPINATLNPSEAGSLTVDYDKKIINVTQDEETGEWIVTGVAEGNTTITFSFPGSERYASAENKTIEVTVTLNDANITAKPDSMDLLVDETGKFNITTTPEDLNIEVSSSNESVATVKLVNRVPTVTAVSEGSAVITVTINDEKYVRNSTTVAVKVVKRPTEILIQNHTLNMEVDDIVDPVVSLIPSDAGNLSFKVSDTNVILVNGHGVVNAVGEGNATVTVSFEGNDKYLPSNATITVTVSAKPAPSKENLTISAAADPITAGDNATVIVTGLKNATGEVYVIIKVDEMYLAPINDGKATITVPGLTESVTANVTYPGDDNYNNASTTVDITVNPAPDPSRKNLTIKASAEPIKAGENATVKVTGLENATGEVSVIANGKTYTAPIKNGEASITVPDLTENTTANVNYKGDDTYNAATTTVNITVNPAPVPEKKNLTIKANAEPITAGENATVKVTGLENATGNVSVRAGNGIYFAPIENGEATVIIPGLKETTTAEVSYPGDDNYNNASTTVDITVNPAPDPSKKNLTIKANAEPIKAGENATVKVTGLENATGEVSVIANGKTYTAPIKNGEASITVPDLTENTTANVNYKGDDTYNSATTTVNITVNPKGKENATISIDAPTEAPEGDNVTVTVTLPEDATGTVTIGNEAVPLVNGTASAVLTNLPAGNTTVPITYSGDEKYNPIETEINITVIEDKTINVKAPDVTKYYHGPERFVVNVTDSQGRALANKSVTITINGVTYNRTTNANGTCSLALNLPVGVYNVTTTVENNTVNSVVTIFTTVNGTDVVKVFRNGTQYYATFLDGNGKYLAEGSAVRFNINGVMYDRKVTGDKGLAKLNINLQQGEYIITATNLNTTEMSSNNITVLSRIIENNDLTKFYRNASQYTVKIIGDDGKVVGTGVDVTFNVNGVLYTRQTNASGIAKLNINLPAGDYIITAECKECKVSNNIKVLPVLTAQDMVKKYGAPDQFVATLVDGQGNPYARQTVQFNINGVLYNRVTDSAGQAKLNIRLMPGQYIITSSYNGCNIANKITVQG